MAVVWFGNEMESVTIQKLLAAQQPDALFADVLKILEDARTKVGNLVPERAAQCRWACPPGECSPDCIPPIPGRILPATRPPLTLDRMLAVLRWEVTVIENRALQALMANSRLYARVRDELSRARVSLGRL